MQIGTEWIGRLGRFEGIAAWHGDVDADYRSSPPRASEGRTVGAQCVAGALARTTAWRCYRRCSAIHSRTNAARSASHAS
jgi:hypothetical protein